MNQKVVEEQKGHLANPVSATLRIQDELDFRPQQNFKYFSETISSWNLKDFQSS